MPDFLVRNVPADALAVYKARAATNGNSTAAEMRAVLVEAAHLAAGQTATAKAADGDWPTDPAMAVLAVKSLVHGFMSAALAALENGSAEAAVMAALTGVQAKDAVTPPAPMVQKPALPHGYEIVSRTYTIPAGGA